MSFLSNITLLIIMFTINLSQDKNIIYEESINTWHNQRIESLKSENGWLNLCGFVWLENNKTSVGSESECKVKLKKYNGIAGYLITEKEKVWFENINGKKLCIYDEELKIFETVKIDNYRFFIIKRNEKLAVRIRDLKSDALINFKEIERYPINEEWRIISEFEPFKKDTSAMIINRMGFPEKTKLNGIATFSKNEIKYSLLVFDEDGKFFIVFSDITSGKETYGGGRFLYAEPHVNKKQIILDFNKAYNPPCCFTPYATCPLPPDKNKLSISITAGEKTYHTE